MRRGVLFLIILAALVFFAWQVVLKPKAGAKVKAAAKKVKTETSEAVDKVKTGGKRAGKLKKLTQEERKAEKTRLRAERRRLKQELRRKKREERLARRLARSTRKIKSKKGKKQTGLYVLQAIIWFDVGPSYAMIDGRKYEMGDVVSGRKIVAIRPDQIIVDYRGSQTIVRMGESLLPKAYFETGRKSKL